jgi:hypothetical protein
LGRNEPDAEIRELLLRSSGLNLALDYLPGSVMFDPAAKPTVDPDVASQAVWFDAFTTNIDRTARNPNLLWWHKELYFIDHGASLYFHHDWRDIERKSVAPFPMIKDHVLMPWAKRLEEAGPALRAKLRRDLFEAILAEVPDLWLAVEKRADYVAYFMRRLETFHV